MDVYMPIIFWKKKSVQLGEQNVSEITVLEWKKFFSIKLFHFHKTDGKQDRFHTHSFNAVSFLLSGNYIEEVVQDGKVVALDRNRSRVIYIPKNEYHRITKSGGCRTILITGPWEKYWKELRELGNSRYQEVTQGAGRVDISVGPVITLID
jgi:hypothetical protein